MKDFWLYLSVFFGGFIAGLIVMVLILKGKLQNNTIQIRRPKIKNSPDGDQDFTSEIKTTSRRTKQDKASQKEARKIKRQTKKIVK